MRRYRLFPKLLPFLLLITPVVAPLACGNSKSDAPAASAGAPSGIFGGASGITQPTVAGTSAVGSAGADAGTTVADVCLNVPQGTRALIDDFEDGDSLALPEVNREAYWFTIKDTSAGTIVPDSNFVPELGGAHGSLRAAHIKASGFSIWGAGFSANISHLAGGIRCPYNASKFTGLRFFARGSGQVRAELLTPEVVDQEYGGKCNPMAGQTCYDTHGVAISLESEWKAYSFPWSAFVQRGFGTQAAFRPDAIMTLQLAFEVGDLPVDVWFDDVSFEDGSPVPPLGTNDDAGAAGAPSGTGAGGDGNSGGAGAVAGQGGM